MDVVVLILIVSLMYLIFSVCSGSQYSVTRFCQYSQLRYVLVIYSILLPHFAVGERQRRKYAASTMLPLARDIPKCIYIFFI